MSSTHASLRGRFPPGRVRVRTVPDSSRARSTEVEASIDATWAEQRALAQRRGLTLHDAPAYRLEDAVRDGDDLDLVLSLDAYRVHSAMKQLHGDPRVRDVHHDRLLIVDALVRTSDDCVLLLSTPKVTGTEIQLVGGTATPGQREIVTGADVFAFAADRVARALDVKGPLTPVAVLGLVEQEIGCVNVVVEVHLDAAAVSVEPRGANELVVVTAAGLAEHLAAGPGYLPAVAHLL